MRHHDWAALCLMQYLPEVPKFPFLNFSEGLLDKSLRPYSNSLTRELINSSEKLKCFWLIRISRKKSLMPKGMGGGWDTNSTAGFNPRVRESKRRFENWRGMEMSSLLQAYNLEPATTKETPRPLTAWRGDAMVHPYACLPVISILPLDRNETINWISHSKEMRYAINVCQQKKHG